MQDASRPNDGAPRTSRIDYTPGAGETDDSRSIPELISGALTNLQNIVRSEVQLAKTEMREEAVAAGKGAGMLIAGALIAFYALGLFLLAAVYALGSTLADWLAALIVGLVVAAVAGVLVMVGKSRLQDVNPKPDQTIQSVKEDVAWVKQQKP